MWYKTIAKQILPITVWAGLRKRRQGKHLKSFERRVVEHRYHDQQLKVLIADGLGEGWYDKDGPWMFELERLRGSKLKPNAVVYDCGAHQGVVALLLAKLSGPDGLVVAVEANAHNVEVARENARLNPDERAKIEVLQAAVAAHDGKLRFSNDFNGQLGHKQNKTAGYTEVEAITLNSLAARYPKPDVIFLDIEGAELLALSAADAVFAGGNMPDWFVEVHAGHGLEALGGTVSEVLDFFRSNAYTLEFSANDGQPFTPLGDKLPQGRFFLIATAHV